MQLDFDVGQKLGRLLVHQRYHNQPLTIGWADELIACHKLHSTQPVFLFALPL